jgi:Ca2+-transporting ATPase
LVARILLTGIILTLAAIFVQWWAAGQLYDVRTQQTMVFTTLCLCIWVMRYRFAQSIIRYFLQGYLQTRNCGEQIVLTVILQMLIVYVPFLQSIFKTTALGWNAMTAILLLPLVQYFVLNIKIPE